MGVEVAIGSAAAMSKLVISNWALFLENFQFSKEENPIFCMEAGVGCKTSV